jgi:DNA-binding transcriptional MerR regulator
VTKALGIRQHVLRYWEEQFPALQPIKRSGNRRYYRPEDVALIAGIDRLVNREGYTLRGARMALEGNEPTEIVVARVAEPAPAALPDFVEQHLLRIRARLTDALAAA